ncbi:MAG: aldo/keto reductase [Victivallales bacterium]|nr:aldo/keto reductase [Victivallales bacterium]
MKFSKMQLGTVQFGLNYGIANAGGKPPFELVKKIIVTAGEGGINSLDTAAAYGDSEEVLGRALAELKLQDKFKIISKVPPVSNLGLSPAEAEDYIVKSVENSVRRLRREYLDVCLFHRGEDCRFFPVLQRLRQKGLIKGAGISLSETKYCDDIIASGVGFVQLPYNILDRRFDDFLAVAGKRKITVFARSIYLQGLLLMPEANISEGLQGVITVRRNLAGLAADAGLTMAELCMRFVLNNPAICSILTGVDSTQQLKQNLQLLNKAPLAADLYQAIKNIVPMLEEKLINPVLWNRT